MKNAIWLFIISLIALFLFLPSYSRMQDLEQKNADYENQLEALRRENKVLVEENRLLEEDPEYLEKVGRERMGLIREGEVVYKIITIPEE